MAAKNIDDNIFDEKILAKRIAEEEDLLTRLQMDLTEKQERKKKVATTIRTVTHKIKVLEDNLTKDAMDFERMKKHKEKYVSKIDTKSINKQIDKRCEDVFGGLLQNVDQKEMQIEVEFEGVKTTFTVSDHKINDHYDRETEDGGSRASIRDGSLRGSVLSGDANLVKKEKKSFISKTFGQMKEDVAAFFSLSPDHFFFADAQNAVFLDDLPIRETLFPFGQKIAKTTPRIKVILINDAKYDELILARIKEEIGEEEVIDDSQHKAELKEAYENEQARKRADQTRKKALEYYQFKQRVYKFKGLISSLLYIVLIVLWLYNVFTNFEFDETFLMRNTTETVFQTYDAQNTVLFYDQLSDQLANTSPSDQSYGFVHFTYVMPGAEIVSARYKKNNCGYSNGYMQKYYSPVGGSCIDPNDEEKGPLDINGTVYYYDNDSDKKVSLPTRKGNFQNLGYRLKINFTDPNMREKISNFVDPFVAKFTSFDFVLYNPSLEKMACVYRIVYRYNRDKTVVEKFSYIFNARKQTQSSRVTQDLVLIIASLLVLNSVFDMIDIVPASKIDLDLDLVWIRKNKKGHIKEEEAQRHKPKFKMIKLGGTVFKIYWPSVVNLLNLLSVSLNVTVVALEMGKHNSIDRIDFTTGEGINCPGLIERKFTTDILYVIVIMLMMLVLLRYIAQFVHFLYNFVLIIQNLVRNTAVLAIVILWLFLTMSLSGVATFGAFYPELDNFGYFYTALVLLLMRNNIILNTEADMGYYDNMTVNIGTGALVALFLFGYIVISFLIIKIITSIAIKSIKEAEGNQRVVEMEEERLREESLILIRERFYEDYKASQNKLKAKAQAEAEKEAEAKEKIKKKK